MLTSCGNKEAVQQTNSPDMVNPDLVNNPATAGGTEENAKVPVFNFEETNYDFGSIKSGDVVKYEYKFTNTGEGDLLITEAQGSCGCTVPEYPKKPIPPGESGVIKVTFSSSGMSGQVAKTVTILANTIPSTKVLTISGEVIK